MLPQLVHRSLPQDLPASAGASCVVCIHLLCVDSDILLKPLSACVTRHTITMDNVLK